MTPTSISIPTLGYTRIKAIHLQFTVVGVGLQGQDLSAFISKSDRDS